jgi:hypothetical protein
MTGDRNITGGTAANKILNWNHTAAGNANWSTAIHVSQGNIGLSDGSAQQVTAAALKKQMTNDLAEGNAPKFRQR